MPDDLESEYWLQYAFADLESAEVILKSTNNYHISIYHSHQAIEKLIKRKYIISNKTFPFVHDLLTLYLEINNESPLDDKTLKDLNFMMNVYSKTRYPKGDCLSSADAKRALLIAKEYFKLLN